MNFQRISAMGCVRWLCIGGIWVLWSSTVVAGVQLLGLSDPMVMPSAQLSMLRLAAVSSRVSDSFCITNSTGGAVSLRFSSGHGNSLDGQSWIAKNASGTPMSYLQYLSNYGGSGEVQVSQQSTGGLFTVTSSQVVKDSASCGSGNVTKSVSPTGGVIPSGGGSYTDIVTVVASPI